MAKRNAVIGVVIIGNVKATISGGNISWRGENRSNDENRAVASQCGGRHRK